MQIQIFFSLIIGTFFLALALTFFAFRQRIDVQGIRVFAFFTLFEAMLALAEILSMVDKSMHGALFWFNLRSIFLGVTPVLWLFFILLYYQRQTWLSKWVIIALFIIPLGTILIPRIPALSHFWVRQEVSFFQADSFWLVDTSTRIPGFWFYIHTNYSLLLVLTSLVVIGIDLFKNKKVPVAVSILLIFGSLAYLAAGFYPAFFSIGEEVLNPILPGIGIGELLQVIAIFKFNFLMPSSEKMNKFTPDLVKNQERESLNLLVLIFVVIAASIASLGFLSFNNFQTQYRSQVEDQLTSISLLKVADIQNWRDERLNDAKTFYNNGSFSDLIEKFVNNPSDVDNTNLIKSWLTAYTMHAEYDQIFYYDSSTHSIISPYDSIFSISKHLETEIPKIQSDGIVYFEDFQRDSEDSSVYLAIIIPIYSNTDKTPLGVMVLHIDPQVYLYPLILRWPVPSKSAETALVRLENDRVVYLSDLRFEKNAILNKFIDLSETNRPSVKAVTGSIGIVEGVNYRNQQVIADVRPVPGTPWFLVSRIDQEEVATPLLERERLSWVLYSSLILASGVGLNLIWRQQKVRSLITNNKIQSEILERDRKLKEAQEIAHLGFWYWDVKTGDVEWSEEVYKIFQRVPENFKPQIDSILNLSPWPEDQKRDQELIDQAIKTHKPGMYEQKFLRPDNSIGHYSSTFLGQFDENDQLVSIVGSVIDITDRTIKEQALQLSEHRFRTLFEHAAVGVAIVDTNSGRFLDINQKLSDFLGYSKEELLYKTYQDITEINFIDINNQNNKKMVSGKIKEYSLEKKYVRKDGKIVWGELIVSPLWEPGEKSKQYHHIAVVKDITEQKKAEFALRESEKKFRETVSNLDEGYFSLTMDGILLEHNQAFNRIIGYENDKYLKGTSLPDFWQEEQSFDNYLEELLEKGFINGYQIKSHRANGEKITLLLSTHLVRDENDQPIRIDGVFVDITNRIIQEERLLASQTELKKLLDQAEHSRRALLTIIEDQKLAQEEIKQLNKTLEDRVAHRTAQLKESNEELESFAYSISHDLRAPLRAIDGYSRILEQDYAKVLDVEGIRLINIVRSSTKNLDRLITDLLSLSRVGRSELKLDSLDMNSMVESIINELTPPDSTNKYKFIVTNLPEGYGDPTLIRHVWMNLISNAIKYSSPKERPCIEISGLSDSKICTYTIKDNGVGFNPEFKEKLFGLFQRLHKTSDFEGTGVGLAIVLRIIKRHNGHVWGNGVLNSGAEFSFTLPKRSVIDEQ